MDQAWSGVFLRHQLPLELDISLFSSIISVDLHSLFITQNSRCNAFAIVVSNVIMPTRVDQCLPESINDRKRHVEEGMLNSQKLKGILLKPRDFKPQHRVYIDMERFLHEVQLRNQLDMC